MQLIYRAATSQSDFSLTVSEDKKVYNRMLTEITRKARLMALLIGLHVWETEWVEYYLLMINNVLIDNTACIPCVIHVVRLQPFIKIPNCIDNLSLIFLDIVNFKSLTNFKIKCK